MYSRMVTKKQVELASKAMIARSPMDSAGTAIFQPGFRLQYHSIDQVAEANEKLEALYNFRDKKWIRPLTVEEIRWIRNERALCQVDAIYWLTRYAFIINWEGQKSRFSPNIAQSIYLDILAEMEERGIAILLQYLKARQLGVSTITELVTAHRVQFYPTVNALVASSDPDKSRKMAGMMEFCWANQPFWLMPNNTSLRMGELIVFGDMDSAVSIQHGTQMSGMARGSTPTVFHLSEVCDYRNPDELIDASLLRAVHDSPWVLGVLESTANGRSGYWYNKWQFNKENWAKSRARLRPVFLPWYVGSDIYPTDTWLKARPVPIDWVPEDLTIKHAERAAAYVRGSDLLQKYLGTSWTMPKSQMWFWEVTRAEYAAQRSLNKFYAELCADDLDAFQSSNVSVFETEVIASMRESADPPIAVMGILAPQSEIPIQLQASEKEIDRSRPPIQIHCNWSPTHPAHDYTLVPLLHRGSAPFDPLGKILIWEWPENGETYGLGTDTSYGLGQDRSVIEGLRKGSISRNDAQVFEYASPYVNSFSLWPFNMALGTLYSTIVNGERKQAKQVIEMAANGENTQNELKKRGWRNFHLWERYDKKRQITARATRFGWFTLPWSRRMMMDMLIDAVNNGWLDVQSIWFIDELADLELEMESQKIKALDGKHDDRIMALTMLLFSLHVKETRHADAWVVRERMQRATTLPQYAAYNSQRGVAPTGTQDPIAYAQSFGYTSINGG